MQLESKQPQMKIMPEIKGEKDFYRSIRKALETTTHKRELLDIIKEFEAYKKHMTENLLPSQVPSDKIFSFRFTYQLKKKVWKEIDVFGDQTLELLAEVVIEEMGWTNDHLHAFFFPEKMRGSARRWYTSLEIGSSGVDNDQYPIFHTDEVLVSSIDYAKYPKLGFVYDFGDDNRFLMEFNGVRKIGKHDDRDIFPKVVDQRGVAPEQYATQ